MTNNYVSEGSELWAPSGSEEHALVRAELQKILASPSFRISRRYPAMLRYIVEKTLQGEGDSLKERTLGVEVFNRTPGYDTNTDPIVRFSAGEVRKRLAQFYQTSASDGRIVIELPVGTYVPRFRHPTVLVEAPDDSVFESGLEPVAQPLMAHVTEVTNRRRVRWSLCIVILFILASVAGTLIYNQQQNRSVLMMVWAPLIDNPNPVLICAGRPHPAGESSVEPPNISIGDHILRPEFRLSITTVAAISNIVGFLQTHQKTFRIREADSNTLADLHDRPVVLLNGDNKWTRLLTKPLRFHSVQDGDYSYFQDSQNPGYRGWGVNFSAPYHTQTTDFALIARFDDPTTGAPVMVIAGISSNGTEAAGEFMVSPKKLANLLSTAPRGWNGHNFEAVLKVQVVNGDTGASSVVGSQFW